MDQKVTKTRPTREGKGGIQDGILLEKKEYCKNQTYCEERVHAGRKHAGHSERQHAPLGRVRPGGEYRDAFWSPFGSLLVPFCSILAPFASLWGFFSSLSIPFGALLLTLGLHSLTLAPLGQKFVNLATIINVLDKTMSTSQ